MSVKTNNMISQEIRKDYSEEAAEDNKVLAQGNDEFDGVDNEFKESHAGENVFDRERAEERATRARSKRASKMAKYATGTANDTKEEEEE